MSKLETPMTLWFWHQVGGLLIEEFVAVRRTASQGQRLIDAVIVLGSYCDLVKFPDQKLVRRV